MSTTPNPCEGCPALEWLATAGMRPGRRPASAYPSAAARAAIKRSQAAARQAANRCRERDARLSDPNAIRRPVQRHRVARPNPNYGGPVPDAGPVVARRKGDPVPDTLPPPPGRPLPAPRTVNGRTRVYVPAAAANEQHGAGRAQGDALSARHKLSTYGAQVDRHEYATGQTRDLIDLGAHDNADELARMMAGTDADTLTSAFPAGGWSLSRGSSRPLPLTVMFDDGSGHRREIREGARVETGDPLRSPADDAATPDEIA